MTLLTALLIAGACICLNLLLYRSGATGMDSLNGYIMRRGRLSHRDSGCADDGFHPSLFAGSR